MAGKIILDNDQLSSGIKDVLSIAENYVKCFADCKKLVTDAVEGGDMLTSMQTLCESFGEVENRSNTSVEQIEYAVEKLKETVELNDQLSAGSGIQAAEFKGGVHVGRKGTARTL